MGKQLVSRDNVEQFICHEEKKLYVGQELILTPGAKDYLQEKSISVVYGEPAQAPAQQVKNAETGAGAAPELSNKIRQLLKSDFSITDSALMDEVTKKVLAKLEQLK